LSSELLIFYLAAFKLNLESKRPCLRHRETAQCRAVANFDVCSLPLI